MEPKYKRVLLKISGEALAGADRTGLNDDKLQSRSKRFTTLAFRLPSLSEEATSGEAGPAQAWTEQQRTTWV